MIMLCTSFQDKRSAMLAIGKRFFRRRKIGQRHCTLCTWRWAICTYAEKDPLRPQSTRDFFARQATGLAIILCVYGLHCCAALRKKIRFVRNRREIFSQKKDRTVPLCFVHMAPGDLHLCGKRSADKKKNSPAMHKKASAEDRPIPVVPPQFAAKRPQGILIDPQAIPGLPRPDLLPAAQGSAGPLRKEVYPPPSLPRTYRQFSEKGKRIYYFSSPCWEIFLSF